MMESVLIITDIDPFAPAPTRGQRLSQMASFYRRAGFLIDLLVLRRGSGIGDAMLLSTSSFRQISTVTAWQPVRGKDRQSVLDLVALTGPGEGYGVVHLDGVDMRPDEDLGAHWIHDTVDGMGQFPESASHYTMALAMHEADRARLGQHGVEAFRLPLSFNRAHTQSPAGPMTGWPDVLNDDEIRDWNALLRDLAARGIGAPDGIALCPSSADALRVPVFLQPELAVIPPASLQSLPGVFGLGVLPNEHIGRNTMIVLDMVQRGIPVLTLAGAAETFEKRWHLPVSRDREELVRHIQDWIEGRSRDDLSIATARTWHAHQEDAEAMESYVRQVLSGVMAGRSLNAAV